MEDGPRDRAEELIFESEFDLVDQSLIDTERIEDEDLDPTPRGHS
jgi:hypothetical protein